MTKTHITYPNFGFEVFWQEPEGPHGGLARRGRITTPHGVIETPNFIFCGTRATVKTLNPQQLKDAGAEIILSNTYHLMIQPGAEIIEKMGGIHKFCGWDGPMLTDSGGYQVFAMQHGSVHEDTTGTKRGNTKQSLLKIKEEGAYFRSYKDGKQLFLSPEISMQLQRQIGADLVVQLDEATAFQDTKDYTALGVERSMRWGDRSLEEFARTHDGTQAVYGVIQGAHFQDLRDMSIDYVNDRDFFGIAIGGSMGKGPADLDMVTEWCTRRARPDRPRHLLGYGRVRDVFAAVKLGVDTLDCVHPTRLARHGVAVVKGIKGERMNLMNAQFRDDPRPIDETCGCYAEGFSRAYIHHLLKSDELLAQQLLTIHNVATMTRLIREIRAALDHGGVAELLKLEKEWLALD
ncbi:MAG TPA: tRNA guanosine(34) transglycosylase Tgt [Alphaproteobacteria bacterium]